jgi:hypothetical protein
VFILQFILLEAFGFPVSWKKVRGGQQVEWIGYWLDVCTFEVGIGIRKVAWMVRWITDRLNDKGIVGRSLQSGLGRFSFVARAIDHIKPFLSPIYAWSAAIHPSGFHYFPEVILALLIWIRARVQEMPSRKCRPLRPQSGEVFRFDAKAEGELIRIGGWETHGNTAPKDARWFSVALSKANAPWAFSKGDPFKVVAALELVGALLCVMIFAPKAGWRETSGRVVLTGFTDNKGNTHVMDKFMSSKYPLCVVLMELAEQLRACAALNLQWTPREQNVEADALTNDEFHDFSMENRMDVKFEEIEFIILRELMVSTGELAAGLAEAKRAKDAVESMPTRWVKKTKLKDSDPW